MSRTNNNGSVAGTTGRRCNGNVAGETGMRRFDCECVFKCLLELLEDALEDNNNHHPCHENLSPTGDVDRRRCNCECVFECLLELLEDALEEDEDDHIHCRRRCPK